MGLSEALGSSNRSSKSMHRCTSSRYDGRGPNDVGKFGTSKSFSTQVVMTLFRLFVKGAFRSSGKARNKYAERNSSMADRDSSRLPGEEVFGGVGNNIILCCEFPEKSVVEEEVMDVGWVRTTWMKWLVRSRRNVSKRLEREPESMEDKIEGS